MQVICVFNAQMDLYLVLIFRHVSNVIIHAQGVNMLFMVHRFYIRQEHKNLNQNLHNYFSDVDNV